MTNKICCMILYYWLRIKFKTSKIMSAAHKMEGPHQNPELIHRHKQKNRCGFSFLMAHGHFSANPNICGQLMLKISCKLAFINYLEVHFISKRNWQSQISNTNMKASASEHNGHPQIGKIKSKGENLVFKSIGSGLRFRCYTK